MLKRLSEPSGAISENSTRDGDTSEMVVRKAILVHAGPDGGQMVFQSGDGPIVFTKERIQKVVEVHNSYMDHLSSEYGGDDKIPMGAYEPILDAHSDDSNDRIVGRLTGRLKFEVRDVPKIGKDVACAIAEPGITFLGKDTVDRVKDGRIYHLSIGISEQSNRIGETSTVVKPAAPGAMLLKQGTPKENPMSVDLKRMKAAQTQKLARLSAMKELVATQTKKLVATQDNIKLTARQDQITHRLKAAIADRKMTPGEFKEIVKNDGLKKLAALDDSTLKIALMPFEARQAPVILTGQRGSTSTSDVADMAKDMSKQHNQAEYKRLRAETVGDFIKMSGGKQLAFGKDDADEKDKVKKEMSGPKEAPVAPGKDDHSVGDQQGDEKQLSHHLALMSKHLADGNIEGVKQCHAALCKMAEGNDPEKTMSEGDAVKSEDSVKSMDALQSQVDELNTQMSRMAGMVDEMMKAESDEGQHFGEMSNEHEKVGAAV